MLPNFLIVGAMKAGTTTLKDYLAEIHQIFMPPHEVYFFSDDSYYARGIREYETLFESANGKQVLGERTTTYSYLPGVPERIKKHIPDVKLIWLFREPVSRSYSNYWHSAKNGSERLSFATAVARENDRVRSDAFRGYLSRSRYADQVERYLQFFPKENMLFAIFEELVREPARVVNQVLEFLSVDSRVSDSAGRKHSHRTYVPRNVQLQWLSRKLFGRTLPYRAVSRFNRLKTPGYPKMPEQLLEQLRQEFLEPNRRLADLTGLDLNLWDRPTKHQAANADRTPVGTAT